MARTLYEFTDEEWLIILKGLDEVAYSERFKDEEERAARELSLKLRRPNP